MKGTFINRKKGGLFFLTDFTSPSYKALLQDSALYKIVLSTANGRTVYVDGKRKTLHKNEVLFCKPLNSLEVIHPQDDLIAIAFNKDFYKVDNPHDEVLFYGFWYFRIHHPLKLSMAEKEMTAFISIFKTFQNEITNKGNIREDIIQKKLRLLLIASSQRVAIPEEMLFLRQGQLNAIKNFANLIEMHFTKKRRIGKRWSIKYLLNFKKIFSDIFRKRVAPIKEGKLFPAGQLFNASKYTSYQKDDIMENRQITG